MSSLYLQSFCQNTTGVNSVYDRRNVACKGLHLEFGDVSLSTPLQKDPINMLVVALLVGLLLFGAVQAASTISLSLAPPLNASDTIIPSFVSFSIEFASFPDFAGQ